MSQVLTPMMPFDISGPVSPGNEYVVTAKSLGSQWSEGDIITDADMAKIPGFDLGRHLRLKSLRRATEFERGQKKVVISKNDNPSYQEELGKKDEEIARSNSRISELEQLLTMKEIQITNFVPGQGLDNLIKEKEKIITELNRKLIVANQQVDGLQKQLEAERSWKQTNAPVLPPERVGDGFVQTPFMRETVNIPAPTDQTETRTVPERLPNRPSIPKVGDRINMPQ